MSVPSKILVLVCQIRTVVSLDAVAMREPSGEKATAFTPSVCPLSMPGAAPVLVCQILYGGVVGGGSDEEPSGENATAFTPPVCPVRIRS